MSAEKKRAQLERFKEAARALGCDKDEAAFDEKLKAIVRQKPRAAGGRIGEMIEGEAELAMAERHSREGE